MIMDLTGCSSFLKAMLLDSVIYSGIKNTMLVFLVIYHVIFSFIFIL